MGVGGGGGGGGGVRRLASVNGRWPRVTSEFSRAWKWHPLQGNAPCDILEKKNFVYELVYSRVVVVVLSREFIHHPVFWHSPAKTPNILVLIR